MMSARRRIDASPCRRRVFEAVRVPWTLRVYEALTNDRELERFRLGGGPRHLFSFAAKRAIRRALFPWLLRMGSGRGTFRYRGSTEHTIEFRAANVQFESAFSRRYRPCYEPRVAALLTHFTPAGGVLFDVGANWGHHALHAAALLGANVRIHAFEPQAAVFDDLVRSVEQAGLAGQVTTHHCALSDRTGTASMTVPRGYETGLASVTSAEGPIPCVRLDDLGLPPPDVLKLDVEGHEVRVLRGAEATLRRSRPFVVFESALLDASSGEAIAYLDALGYELFEPVWSIPDGSTAVLTRDDAHGLAAPDASIVLIAHRSDERQLLPSFVNLLAAHPERARPSRP